MITTMTLATTTSAHPRRPILTFCAETSSAKFSDRFGRYRASLNLPSKYKAGMSCEWYDPFRGGGVGIDDRTAGNVPKRTTWSLAYPQHSKGSKIDSRVPGASILGFDVSGACKERQSSHYWITWSISGVSVEIKRSRIHPEFTCSNKSFSKSRQLVLSQYDRLQKVLCRLHRSAYLTWLMRYRCSAVSLTRLESWWEPVPDCVCLHPHGHLVGAGVRHPSFPTQRKHLPWWRQCRPLMEQSYPEIVETGAQDVAVGDNPVKVLAG